MSMMFRREEAARKASRLAEGTFHGIAEGTHVFAARGAVPVESLSPGDRVVTREGMRVLSRVWVEDHAGPVILVKAGTLGHAQPARDLKFAAGTPVVMRQWRSRGQADRCHSVVPLLRLVDGVEIRRGRDEVLRTYTLQFDTDQVVYAEGLEVFCEGAGTQSDPVQQEMRNIFLG